MVKKKLLRRLVTPVIAIAMLSVLSSFTDENESGGGCDLCIIKENKTILFSCKVAPNQTCSKEKEINDPELGKIKVKVSCAGAVAC